MMSTKLERELDAFLFFGGPMPDLSQGMSEVPMPDSCYVCMLCGVVSDTSTCEKCDYEMNQRYDEEHGK